MGTKTYAIGHRRQHCTEGKSAPESGSCACRPRAAAGQLSQIRAAQPHRDARRNQAPTKPACAASSTRPRGCASQCQQRADLQRTRARVSQYRSHLGSPAEFDSLRVADVLPERLCSETWRSTGPGHSAAAQSGRAQGCTIPNSARHRSQGRWLKRCCLAIRYAYRSVRLQVYYVLVVTAVIHSSAFLGGCQLAKYM